MTRTESPTTPASRLHVIDGARGAALLGMFVYHFAWDLDFYGLIAIDTGAGGWAVSARVVAGSFLFLVGVSLVLATRDGFKPKLFLRRLGLVAGAAMLVTLATWWLTPTRNRNEPAVERARRTQPSEPSSPMSAEIRP